MDFIAKGVSDFMKTLLVVVLVAMVFYVAAGTVNCSYTCLVSKPSETIIIERLWKDEWTKLDVTLPQSDGFRLRRVENDK